MTILYEFLHYFKIVLSQEDLNTLEEYNYHMLFSTIVEKYKKDESVHHKR